jgi:hypothetical protein
MNYTKVIKQLEERRDYYKKVVANYESQIAEFDQFNLREPRRESHIPDIKNWNNQNDVTERTLNIQSN